eukprot:GHVP01039040.1.p1 GENE.GHVP01039040.1~~GHVP01039040.1.p1  ORF type:complete len:2570 (-),score=521.82 GHVP01039040.1:59-7732(-)
MCEFSLRSFVDMCSPPRPRFKENAIAAVELGILPKIKEIFQKYKNDDVITGRLLYYFWALSESCKEFNDKVILERIISEGGIEMAISIMKVGHENEELMNHSMVLISNFEEAGIDIDPRAYIPAMIEILAKSKSPQLQAKALNSIAAVSMNAAGVRAIGKNNGSEVILSVINDENCSIGGVETGTVVLARLASQGFVTAGHLEHFLTIMERHTANLGIVQNCALSVKSVIGPEQLKSCLAAISDKNSSDEERKKAFSALGGMSYVPAYGEVAAKSGAIPILVEAIRQQTSELSQGNKEVIKPLEGAIKMLASACSFPAYQQEAIDAKALEVSMALLESAKDKTKIVLGLFEIFKYLTGVENYAKLFIDLKGTSCAMSTVKDDTKNYSLAFLKLIQSTHRSVVREIVKANPWACCAKIGNDNLSNSNFMVVYLSAMRILLEETDDISVIADASIVKIVAQCATMHAENPKTAIESTKFFMSLSLAKNGLGYFKGEATQSLLDLLFFNQHEQAISKECTELLFMVATAEDIQIVLDNLTTAIPKARTNPSDAFRVLAGLSGLAGVSRLRVDMTNKNPSMKLADAIVFWIEGPEFESQQGIISSACRTYQTLSQTSSNSYGKSPINLLKAANSNGMKNLVGKQSAIDSNLVILLNVMATLFKVEKFENVPEIVAEVMKIKKNNSDSRRVQKACIDVLASLANHPEAAETLFKSGIVKQIVAEMPHRSLYEDVQLASLNFQNHLLKTKLAYNKDLLELDAKESVFVALRAHRKSHAVKEAASSVLRLLIPSDELEKLIRKALSDAQKAMEQNDGQAAILNLTILNDLSYSPEGQFCTAKCKAGARMKSMSEWLLKQPCSAESVEIAALMSHVYRNTALTRLGQTHLRSNEAPQVLLNLCEYMRKCPDHVTKKQGIGSNIEAIHLLILDHSEECGIKMSSALKGVSEVMMGFPQDENIQKYGAKTLGTTVTVDSPDVDIIIGTLIAKVQNSKTHEEKHSATEALVGALQTSNAVLIKKAVDQGAAEALFEVAHNSQDFEVIRLSMEGLDSIAKFSNFKAKLTNGPGQSPETMLGKMKEMLSQRGFMEDPASSAAALRVLAQCTSKDDTDAIIKSGILDPIHSIYLKHLENKDVKNAVGAFVSNLDIDVETKNTMQEIINIEKNKLPGWQQKMAAQSGHLALLLAGTMKNPKSIAPLEGPLGECIARTLKSNPKDVCLISTLPALARIQIDNQSDPKIKAAINSAVSPALIEIFSMKPNDTMAPKNKRCVIDSYGALAAGLSDPSTRKASVELAKKSFIESSGKLLSEWSADPDATKAIVSYMKLVAEIDKTHADLVMKNANLAELLAIATAQEDDSELTVACIGYADILVAQDLVDPLLRDPKKLQELQNQSTKSPAAAAAFLGLSTRLLQKKALDGEAQAILPRNMVMWKVMQGEPNIAEEELKILAEAEVAFMMQCEESELMAQLKQDEDPIEMTVEMMSVYGVELAGASAFLKRQEIEKSDDDVAVAVVAAKLTTLLFDSEAIAQMSAHSQEYSETIKILQSISAREGVAQLIADNVNYKSGASDALSMAESLKTPEGAEILATIKAIQIILEDNTEPTAMTLQAAEIRWRRQLEANIPLEIDSNPIVSQLVDFVFDYTEEYLSHSQDPKSELGKEVVAGLACIEMLAEVPANGAALVDKQAEMPLLKGMNKQKSDFILTCVVRACRKLCELPEPAQVVNGIPQSNTIACRPLNKLLEKVNSSEISKEEFFDFHYERLRLIEVMALTRETFNYTEAFTLLNQTWQLWESGNSNYRVLAANFKAMRKIINNTYGPEVLEEKFPERLLEIIKTKKPDPEILEIIPDVLFVLGNIGVMPQIKDQMEHLKGIEQILDLIVRCRAMKVDTSKIKTNACLSLSTLCMLHTTNTGTFCAKKGMELNISLLAESVTVKNKEWDVANGASILVCNISYKRDDLKQKYGQMKAPAAVMATISFWEGQDDNIQIRCLNSMFKAIANLALYSPNVQAFVDGQLDKVLESFYKKGATLPDFIMDTSFRTVGNLVLTSTPVVSQKIGKCIPTVLEILKTGKRNPAVLATALEFCSNLCRQPENSTLFVSSGGIPIVLEILTLQQSMELYAPGLKTIGMQSSDPRNVITLLENGVFDFLIALLNDQAERHDSSAEITVNSLRCTRKIMKHSKKDNLKEFLTKDGVVALSRTMTRFAEIPVVTLEVVKVLLLVVSSFEDFKHRPSQIDLKDEFSAPVKDEYVLSLVKRMERPLGPRKWEKCGLNVDLISEFVYSLLSAMRENARLQQKLIYCAYTALAYFACEKIEGLTATYIGGNICELLTSLNKMHPKDPFIHVTGATIFANLAVVCDLSDWNCFKSDEYAQTLKTFTDAKYKIPTEDKELMLTVIALMKTDDPEQFQSISNFDYDLFKSKWNDEKYPNGPQDLPENIKAKIVAGGVAQNALDATKKGEFHWKSSLDLMLIQWKFGVNDGTFSDMIGVSRIRQISMGHHSQALKQAVAKDNTLSAGNVCVIYGPATDKFPEGIELNLKFPSQQKRDQFVGDLGEWREAATFGF